MDDLISRQAAIDALMVAVDDVGVLDAEDIETVFALLPSAQPEITRCRDCKHRDAENLFCEGRGWPMQLVPDDGFCDKGERDG